MRDPITLRLGGAVYKIRPLTLRQVETIESLVINGGLSGVRQGKAILAAAMARDHAGNDVEEIEATPTELGDAVSAILVLGGFVPETASGEAPAAALNAQTGDSSAAV